MQALAQRHRVDVAEEARDTDVAGLDLGEAGRRYGDKPGDEHQGADRTGAKAAASIIAAGLALTDNAKDKADHDQH